MDLVQLRETTPEIESEHGLAARPKRADAVKNRDRILRAAQEVFAAEGVGAPIDSVAQRAGVGVGTLYRNFPTKEALFEAIVIATLQDLLDRAQQGAAAEDPAAALFSFLEDFAAIAVAKRDLRDALDKAGVDPKAHFSSTMADLDAAIAVMLDRAAQAGAVRSDVTAPQVLSLMAGACHAAELSGLDYQSCLTMAQVVCAGLRSPGA